MIAQSHFDVIVIGGGPAGSTAAALLAEKGHRVLLLEKEKFPRYHVGESLMPFCWFTLERLGVLEEMNRIAFTKKYSVQFVTPDGRQSQPFYFFEHSDHPSSTTWQVERADFDLMLLENARKKGAEVRELTPVQRVIKDDSGRVIGVEAAGPDGKVFRALAQMTIDCSGREQVATARDGWRVKDTNLNKLAIWTYYRAAKRDPGIDEGNTTVAYVEDRGWFWYIPLRGDLVSVGIVAEKDYLFSDTKDPAEILKREIGRNEWIKDHLSAGEQVGQYWVTSEFSYRSKFCAGDGLLLAGDAFAFLDPVFSSGVFLALISGEMAADAVDAALVAGDTSGAQFADYGGRLCDVIESMRKLVYAFYDVNFSFGKMLKRHPEQRARLTDCLIGNLAVDFTALFSAMNELVQTPAPLPHGREAAPSLATV
ncbi:MAG: glucose-inhibited division protein [Chthoniobacteraceae bacterium]|nr:glucose-inhibited division protein [Chthoniobacteraceae bacterium]